MNGELPMLEARFLAHIDVERGLSAATVQAYENDIDQYVRWLGEQGIAKAASITSNDVEDFVAAQSKSGTSAVSLARRLASIHMFHRFMQSERVVADGGLSAATVQAYENDIDQYVRWLGEQGIAKAASITSNDVEDFVAAQSKAGTSAVSLARRLASIHMFHRFMQSERVVADDVSQSVRPPKSAETLPEVLTVDEVQRLLDAARHDDASEAVSMRDSALLELMYATGCRVSEAWTRCSVCSMRRGMTTPARRCRCVIRRCSS